MLCVDFSRFIHLFIHLFFELYCLEYGVVCIGELLDNSIIF